MARYHGNQCTLTHTGVGSNTASEIARASVKKSSAKMDGAVHGDSSTTTDVGLLSCQIQVTFYLDPTEALPTQGSSGALVFIYKTGTTPGQITGTFVITDVSASYNINNNAAVDVTFENQGDFTDQAPVA